MQKRRGIVAKVKQTTVAVVRFRTRKLSSANRFFAASRHNRSNSTLSPSGVGREIATLLASILSTFAQVDPRNRMKNGRLGRYYPRRRSRVTIAQGEGIYLLATSSIAQFATGGGRGILTVAISRLETPRVERRHVSEVRRTRFPRAFRSVSSRRNKSAIPNKAGARFWRARPVPRRGRKLLIVA